MDKQCVRLQSSEVSDWAQLRAGDLPVGSAHEVGRALHRIVGRRWRLIVILEAQYPNNYK